MNTPTNHNKFFKVQVDESEGQALTMIPSEYLDELNPYQAIAEMQEYIETLENALGRYSQDPTGVRANIGKAGSLAFEVDLVRAFLASFKHTFGTMH
jgi:hypothetical protein